MTDGRGKIYSGRVLTGLVYLVYKHPSSRGTMTNEVSAQEGTDTTKGPVLSKCDDKTAPGYWLCVTHDESFPNNMSMSGHTDRGRHVVAWVCSAHGPEVP